MAGYRIGVPRGRRILLLAAAVLVAAVGLLPITASTPLPGPGGTPDVGAGASLPPDPAAAERAAGLIGSILPDLRLRRLDGDGSVDLGDTRGQPLLINFWASWCPPCREEFPLFAEARAVHAAAGLGIVGIAHRDEARFAREFVDELRPDWPIVLDEDQVAWRALGGVGLPTSVVADGRGVIRLIHFGPFDRDSLDAALATVLDAGADDATSGSNVYPPITSP